ncbi:hypothetical protein CsSME_00040994 [Camellia sinensis var. sinensis]
MGREHKSNNKWDLGFHNSRIDNDDDDDIYSDLDTDLDNVAAPVPSSSLSMVISLQSENTWPFSFLNTIPSPTHPSPRQFSEDEFHRSSDEKSQFNNQKLKCTTSQTYCTYKKAKPFGNALASASNSDTEQDIDKENVQPRVGNGEVFSCYRMSREMSALTHVVSGRVTQDFANRSDNCNSNKGKCQTSQRSCLSEIGNASEELHKRRSSQNICSSKTENPCGDAPASKSDGIIAGKESQPENHSRKCQGSQRNYHSRMMKHFDGTTESNMNEMVMCESISNFPEKDIIKEDAVPDLALSKRGVKKQHNRRGARIIDPYKMEKPCGDTVASKSDGIIAGKSIFKLAEEYIDKVNAQPGSPLSMCREDEKLKARNYYGECQSSQSNCSSKTTKPLEDNLVLNSNKKIAGKSISNFLEKDMNEDVVSSSHLSTRRDEKLESNNHKRKCQSYHSNCSSKISKPVDNRLVSDSVGMVAGKSISNFHEKNINKQDPLPDEELECNSKKRKCQTSQRSYPSEMVKTSEDEELQPDILRWKCQGSQSNYPSKMMKPFDDNTKSNLNEVVTSESICNLFEKSMITEDAVPDLALLKHGATRTTSSTGDQNTFLESRDSYVKLRIKSFTVPEFLVEIPETSTIGFLKRKIMEKATGIVGGAHVGVLLPGKKIGDENKTLSETAISNESRLDVILEPIPSHVPHSCPLQLPCDISQPLARCSYTPVVHQGTPDTSLDPLLCNSGNLIQGDHDLVESQTNILVGKNTAPMEVIALPAMSVEPLDMSPMHEKSNSSQNVQRRRSEFYSISEVEALVQEVEKLGTGRWKKIREQAFGNASNRTHTDLKDKWRALVKTAKIPVNKRRGVVLPQELLDRVLAIETHNSRLRATQHYYDPFSLS